MGHNVIRLQIKDDCGFSIFRTMFGGVVELGKGPYQNVTATYEPALGGLILEKPGNEPEFVPVHCFKNFRFEKGAKEEQRPAEVVEVQTATLATPEPCARTPGCPKPNRHPGGCPKPKVAVAA